VLKKLTNVVTIVLLSLSVAGQELIANGSFEDINTCTEYHAHCNPSAWFYLKQIGSTGYYYSDKTKSASGSLHLELSIASERDSTRAYWETMLLCPLQAGEKYKVRLAIAAHERGPNLHDIGLYFTNRLFSPWSDTLLQPRDYVNFLDAEVKEGKNGWFEITKTFTATSNATCLVIGNFSPESNADILAKRRSHGASVLLVDDLSITPVTRLSCPLAEHIKDSLYAIHERHRARRKDSLPAPEPAPAMVTTPPPPPPHTDTLKIDNISFDFDKADIKNPEVLDKYHDLLTRPGLKKVLVAGFTDDMGSASYNLELSSRRAHAVAVLLSSKCNIDAGSIQSEGRGISRAYTDKAMNRRVEIYLYY